MLVKVKNHWVRVYKCETYLVQMLLLQSENRLCREILLVRALNIFVGGQGCGRRLMVGNQDIA